MGHDLRFATALIVLLFLGSGCSSKSSADSDWEEVQKAATRVESGIRLETLIALRSKVADLDAAVANYVRVHGGQQNQRVRSINQAVEALEWAMDHQTIGLIWDGTDNFVFYATRSYLALEPQRAESQVSCMSVGLKWSTPACLMHKRHYFSRIKPR
jgi:hypothetical protein